MHAERRRPRHRAPVGRVEPRDYEHYRRTAPRVRRRVRLPGAARPWRRSPRRSPTRPLRRDSPGVLHHQKAEDGNGKLRAASPTTSARSPTSTTGTTSPSSTRPGRSTSASSTSVPCTALLGRRWWQLNDCWPSSLGGHRRRRPAQAALVRAAPLVRRPPGRPPTERQRRAPRPRPRQRHRRYLGGAADGTASDPDGAVLDEVALDTAVGPRSVARLTLPRGEAAETV